MRICLLLATLCLSAPLFAQICPDVQMNNYLGGGQVSCPCFVAGEVVAASFEAPADHYPIQILKVAIGWGSQFGGTPQALHDSINIYAGAPPAVGPPIAVLAGPVLTDGAINEYNFETSLPGDVIIDSGPFTVGLQFLTATSIFDPAPVHDGAGCIVGQNWVMAIPGGWLDTCGLGVTGNWVIHVVYKEVDCGIVPVGPEFIRGDCNNDGSFDIADAIFALNFLFVAADTIDCSDACDGNDDGGLDIADVIAKLNALFVSTPVPAPDGICGEDPTSDALDCTDYAGCP